MTFQSPWLLLGLLLIPLLAVAYVSAERRRRRAASAFAAPVTAASVVPRKPGWRRHLPLALAGMATAALIGALARPQVSIAVPAEQATIVLAMDHSGSMAATDVSPSRLVAAEKAAEAFLAKVPAKVRVGGVVFNNSAQAIDSPTTDREDLKAALEAAMKPSGGTATGDALATSLEMIKATKAPGAIVLLSDGKATHGRDPLPVADAAKQAKVPIYTVALGHGLGHAAQRRRGAAGHDDAEGDRRPLGRRGVHRVAVERSERGLHEARLRGRDQARAARGHERVRGRRGDPVAARRLPLA